MRREVMVKLPGPLVWDLSKNAEARDMTVAEYLRTLITPPTPEVLVIPDATRETHARIVAMVHAGLDDGQIADELGKVRGYIADVRRRYGLKPNTRKESK